MGKIMNYDEYVKLQTSSPIKKPKKYRDGQRKAIEWFFKDVPKDRIILDVGCGLGVGMLKLKDMGFKYLVGVEINEKKVERCKRKGLDVLNCDIEDFQIYYHWFSIVWLSHSFEHVFRPKRVLEKLKPKTVHRNAQFFFVLPYPDLDPAPAHTASEEIGLNIDDEGVTLVKWFEDQGLELIEKKFDNFREKEIWLKFKKI